MSGFEKAGQAPLGPRDPENQIKGLVTEKADTAAADAPADRAEARERRIEPEEFRYVRIRGGRILRQVRGNC